MSIEGQKFYPGDGATAEQIVILAIEYDRAAEFLWRAGRRREPLSWAPYRTAALHAVELYLNAFLVSVGHSNASVRGCRHDFGSRARLAVEAGLQLTKRTQAHLGKVQEIREYLFSRYEPGTYETSPLNRLRATQLEVASKVTLTIDK